MHHGLWKEEKPKPPTPDEPYHIRWIRDFIDTQLELLHAEDIDALLQLKNATEKRLLEIQNTQDDPFIHEEVPYRR